MLNDQKYVFVLIIFLKAIFQRRRINSDPPSINVDEPMTIESLAMKLGDIVPNIVKNGITCPDLKDFDVTKVETVDSIISTKKKLSKKLKNLESDRKMDINFDNAAIAGAKICVDQRPATRTLTKRLAKEAGIDESTLMYKPLPAKKRELAAAKDIIDFRQESILESFIDFQKQLAFKKNILNHLDKKIRQEENPWRRASAAGRISGTVTPKRKLRRRAITTQKTPEKPRKSKPDPLRFTKILDNYADMIASEIKERSTIKEKKLPIPIDLDAEDTGY